MSEDEAETIGYRRLWLADLDAITGHLLRLPPESRHNRFAMGVSDHFIAQYVQRSIGLESAVYGFVAGGVLRGIGELRPVSPGRLMGLGGEMECAFSIEPEWRKQGVGTELMRLVIRAARARCCTTLYLTFLAGNVPMRRIAAKFGAEIETDRSEAAAQLKPELPTPATLWGQTMDNAMSLAIAALSLSNKPAQPERRAG